MGLFKRKKKGYNGPIGYLVFDTSMPGTAPYLALDQVGDLESIAEADFVTLKVIRTNGGSQK